MSGDRALPFPRQTTARWAILVIAIVSFAALAYGPEIGLPFIGDDYVFLDAAQRARFLELLSFEHQDFGWYRPWSREVHFYSLSRMFGPHEVPFRLCGLVLWLVGLALYVGFVRRIASGSTAAVAALGVASLAMWGTPLLWISGSQDLWMLLFAMAALGGYARGWRIRTLAAFALALASKETAAVLPLLLFAYSTILERLPARAALRRVAPFAALALAWVFVHPTLLPRLFASDPHSPEVEHRPGLVVVALRTILATVNLDRLPRPSEVVVADLARVLLSALVLAGAAAWMPDARPSRGPGSSSWNATRFGVAWAVIGWLPLLLPSIGWHAYYGCLGTLGAWLAIASVLVCHRSLAVSVLPVLAILRGAAAATPTWDWGSVWYQRRAGVLLASIRSELTRLEPRLPHHSRVYFAHIPNNVGLIAGQSPAVRIWYRDSTLSADFYSRYRPRVPGLPGTDYFFRFDSTRGMVEVNAGAEDALPASARDTVWEADHQNLAVLFLESGDRSRAASEFVKLSRLEHRPDAAVYAGVCLRAVGREAAADSILASAGRRMGMPRDRIEAWAERLRTTMPARLP